MKCKYCKKKGFNGAKGLATHRRYSLSCLEKFNKEQKEINNSKSYIKCEVCGEKLRNISNTHLKKHGITQQEYKVKYPNSLIFARDLLEEQKNKRESTIKKRYTKKEIIYLKGEKAKQTCIKKYGKDYYKEKQRKRKESNPEKYKEHFKNQGKKVRKYWKELKESDPEKYKEKKETRLSKRIKTNLEKYGIEFPQSLEITKRKQKETLIKNYGNLKKAYSKRIEKSFETKKKHYGRYAHFYPCFSLESQKLFQQIENKLKDLNFNFKCYYAISGDNDLSNEYQIKVESNEVSFRYLDFYIPELYKYIEFDESYHKYKIDDDKKREEEIFKAIPSIQLLRIKQEDYEKEPKNIIQKCINFILSL